MGLALEIAGCGSLADQPRPPMRGHLSYVVSNPKIALWTILLASATLFNGEYTPRMRWVDLRYSRACSSDQKNTFSRQKSSTMLGPSTSNGDTSGVKTKGSASKPSTRMFISPSTSRVKGSEQ